MVQDMKPALLFTVVLTVLTGVVYPLLVTGVSQALLPRRANGSLIERDGRCVGSELIGQPFSSARYFWSRPSATAPAYNAASSSGSNLGPTSSALAERVTAAVARLRTPGDAGAVPVDLATTSASGLDPHISPAAALYQVARVAAARGLPEERVRALLREHVEARQLGFLGEPRVNVLRLNLALDELAR